MVVVYYFRLDKRHEPSDLVSSLHDYFEKVHAKKKKLAPNNNPCIDMLCEIPKKGAILAKISAEGNVYGFTDPKNRSLPNYAGFINFLGFNEETKYFKGLENKLDSMLKDYRFLRGTDRK
ncbi:MAG: hypothetical protein ACLFUO_02785 [Candidatus Woesearchaeota archaeon]